MLMGCGANETTADLMWVIWQLDDCGRRTLVVMLGHDAMLECQGIRRNQQIVLGIKEMNLILHLGSKKNEATLNFNIRSRGPHIFFQPITEVQNIQNLFCANVILILMPSSVSYHDYD